MATLEPFAAIKRAFLKLSATREGFEGLAGALLEELSGGLVRLMPSGDQRGPDGLSDSGSGPRLAMQAKRYRDTTSLKLGDLMSEMDRASQAYAFVETWVLVTTKTLLAKDIEVLEEHAESLGWTLVVLDWTLEHEVPRLVAASAILGDRIQNHISNRSALSELRALKAIGNWRAAAATLQEKLRGADAGFSSMQMAARGELVALHTDPAAARHRAGPSPALMAVAPPISRDTLRKSMDLAWRDGGQAIVLLGPEGVGKTWGALDRLETIAATPPGTLPLVISAELALRTQDALGAVVGLLRELSEASGRRLRDPDLYWRRKLRLWRNAPRSDVSVTVLIDGLDEAMSVDWGAYLAPLFETSWHGLFSVVLTCREDEWHREVAPAVAWLESKIVPVPAFSTEERDEYLAQRGVPIADLSKLVLESALHPRTAFHLTRLSKELPDLKRVTREQLLLLDYQNHWVVKGKRPLTPDGFRQLVCNLAGTAQKAAGRSEAFRVSAGTVVQQAADIAGQDRNVVQRVLSDLVSGGWCRRDAQSTTEIEFNDDMLPPAVGMALAAQLNGQSLAHARAALTRFLEPWGADDLTEAVLRMCATALLLDKADEALCEMVLEAWTERPFRRRAASDVWRRLHVLRPELFLRLCHRHGATGHTWLNEWGIACLYEDHAACRPLIEAALFEWASCLELPNVRPDVGAFRERRRRRVLARTRLLAVTARDPKWHHRLEIERRKTGSLAIAVIAFRVMSLLPRRPFLSALVGWAVTAAMSDARDLRDSFRWLLRGNVEDPEATRSGVLEAVDALAVLNDQISRCAAALLLEATGEPDDARRAETLWPRLARWEEWGERDGEPAEIEIGKLDRMLAENRGDLTLAKVLRGLGPHQENPDLLLSAGLSTHLAEALDTCGAAEVQHLAEDKSAGLDGAFRWSPHATARALTRAIVAPLNPMEAAEVAYDVFPVVPASIRLVAAATLRQGTSGTARRARTLDSHGIALSLAGRPFREQARLLLDNPEWPSRWARLLTLPTPDEIADELALVDWAAPRDELLQRLRLVTEVLERHPVEAHDQIDWGAAFAHTDPEIHELALQLANALHSVGAARRLADMRWTAGDHEAQPVRFLGSALLLLLPDEEVSAFLSRLDVAVLEKLALREDSLGDAAAALRKARLEADITTPRDSWSGGGARRRYVDEADGFAAVVRRLPTQMIDLARQVWNDPKLRRNIEMPPGEGAGWQLILSLAECDPELVISILKETSKERNPFRPSLDSLIGRLPGGDAFDALRMECYDGARDDAALFNVVRQLRDRERLILSLIEADLDSPRAARRARGLTAAGYLPATDDARRLWADTLHIPPDTGWLRGIWREARSDFDRGQRIIVWVERTVASEDEAVAFAAYRMLVQVADDRVWPYWNRPTVGAAGEGRVEWLNYLAADRLSRACKARREALAKQRFHTLLKADVVAQPHISSSDDGDARLTVIVS